MDPILYILMRTDLASMNPGKACAQASHATSLFEERILEYDVDHDYFGRCGTDWAETRSFGTVLVLGVDYDEMIRAVKLADEFPENILAGIVNDPTYPLRDGDFTHYIPVQTCAYVFGTKNDCAPIVSGFNLMP